MTMTELGVPDERELRAMQVLAARYPERSTHAVDLPYRLAWARPGHHGRVATALWHEGDELVGWAVWAPGSRETQVTVHPDHAARLWPQILAWGTEHARAQAAGGGEPASWWVSAREDDVERIALLEANGFQRQAWKTVQYERDLSDVPPPGALPDGLSVRPLAGAAEIPAYVAAHRAAFNSTNMNDEWRQRILRVPGYRPDLDLVVAAPDGRVVAFAILWLGPESAGRCEGQFEPVGVHPDFQRRGLGRAILLEGMRRLRAAGATHALVGTENTRTAANALYGSVMKAAGVRTQHFSKAV